jgi:hypothetical protein
VVPATPSKQQYRPALLLAAFRAGNGRIKSEEAKALLIAAYIQRSKLSSRNSFHSFLRSCSLENTYGRSLVFQRRKDAKNTSDAQVLALSV